MCIVRFAVRALQSVIADRQIFSRYFISVSFFFYTFAAGKQKLLSKGCCGCCRG